MGPTPSSPCWVLVALGRPQLTDAGWWLVLAGDIVDSSADSPPSLKARTHSVSTGGSAVHAGGGGHTSPWGRGALSPLLAPSMGTGPTGTGGHRHVGRIPPSGGCASLEMVDGHPAHCPVPGLAAGWFPAPSLGLSLLDAHSSILPAPQMRPSAAQPPGRSPAPSPGQPGEPWEGSCLLSLQPAAWTSPGAPSP